MSLLLVVKKIKHPMAQRTEVSPRKVSRLFSSIAGRYDLANTLLSLNRDAYWRRLAVEEAGLERGDRVLDVATGTGKLAEELAGKVGDEGWVVAIDFNAEMLDVASERAGRNTSLVIQDGTRLALKDGSFKASTLGFGIRNMACLERAIAEMARVVEKGGRVAILEFALPENRFVRALYSLYFFRILPYLGGLIAGDREAYTHLVRSVSAFPKPRELKALMEKHGLEVEYHLLTLGIAVLYIGVKK